LVLVIDDDPSIRELHTTLPRGEAYRVETAVDGQDALNQLGGALDLILLDQTMPFMDGSEYLRRLRRSAKHASTPVIILSAHCAGATFQGEQAVIQKPFDVDALLGRVSGLLALAN
jgi:DNA-binding response OmpR family regulator